MQTPTLGQLATENGAQVVGDPDLAIIGLAPLDQAAPANSRFSPIRCTFRRRWRRRLVR